MRRAVGAALAVGAIAALVPPTASAGSFSVTCPHVGDGAFDPIVSYGRPAAHDHMFRGNHLAMSPWATHGVLRSADATQTSCVRESDTHLPGSGDASAYWAPSLVFHGRDDDGDGQDDRFPPTTFATYYASRVRDPSAIRPFPPGTKLIAGNARATSPQPQWIVRWSCGPGGTFRSSPFLQCIDNRPLDSVRPTLRVEFRFPSCMRPGAVPSDAALEPEGSTRTDFNDTAGVRYPVDARGGHTGVGGYRCPASHPVPLPELHLIFGWGTAGQPGLGLSNHNPHGAHADFFSGWDPAVLEKLVRNCVRVPGAVCGLDDEDERR